MSEKQTKPLIRRRLGRGARVAGLTALEAEVLRALYLYRDKLNTPYARGEREPGWCRPHDIGGSQQSHHSNTLRRLVEMGYVLAKPYLTDTSPARIYRISESGLSVLALYAEHGCAAAGAAEFALAKKKNGTEAVPS